MNAKWRERAFSCAVICCRSSSGRGILFCFGIHAHCTLHILCMHNQRQFSYPMQNNCSCFRLIFCFCCCAFKHISFVRNLGHIVFKNVCAKIVLYCADRQNAVLFPFNVIIKSILLKMSVHWHRDASLSMKICSPSIFAVSLNTQTANWHKYILFTINTSKSWEMQYQYNSLNLHRRLQCNVCMII